jgi:hypothetical protein
MHQLKINKVCEKYQVVMKLKYDRGSLIVIKSV